MKFELKTFTNPIILLFFLFLGFLEAGWQGAVAGAILYGIAITSILIALIPFVGIYFWYSGFMFLANNLGTYIPIPDLIYKITWIVGVIAGVICVTTSVLTVTLIILYWKYGRPKPKGVMGGILPSSIIDSIAKLIPADLLKNLNFTSIQDFINKIIEQVTALWAKMNQKLIGSIIMFLGIGIASHDFFWESTIEKTVDSNRPTHGAYEGLQLITIGLQILVADKSFGDQVKSCLLGYLGIGMCYLGFFLMQFIPKGISRVINHFFWWSGISLIIYNWYKIMGTDILMLAKAKAKP